MRVIPLLLAALLSLASPALTGHNMSQIPVMFRVESPQAIVARVAALERVGIADLRAIWWMENREGATAPEGKRQEQGAFQVRAIAAREAGCPDGWNDDFTLNAQCGAKYLRLGLERCGGRFGGAAHFYNRGHCPRRGKIAGYAQEAQRAKAGITMRTRL